MSQNPFANAGAAAAYITAGGAIAFYVGPYLGSLEDTIAAPILMLSLMVLSVAVMGYLFFYQPVLLLLGGKQKEGAELFLRTLGSFAGITLAILIFLSFFAPGPSHITDIELTDVPPEQVQTQ